MYKKTHKGEEDVHASSQFGVHVFGLGQDLYIH